MAPWVQYAREGPGISQILNCICLISFPRTCVRQISSYKTDGSARQGSFEPADSHDIPSRFRGFHLDSTRRNHALSSHLVIYCITLQIAITTRPKEAAPCRQCIRHASSSLGGLYGMEQKIRYLNCALRAVSLLKQNSQTLTLST